MSGAHVEAAGEEVAVHAGGWGGVVEAEGGEGGDGGGIDAGAGLIIEGTSEGGEGDADDGRV